MKRMSNCMVFCAALVVWAMWPDYNPTPPEAQLLSEILSQKESEELCQRKPDVTIYLLPLPWKKRKDTADVRTTLPEM